MAPPDVGDEERGGRDLWRGSDDEVVRRPCEVMVDSATVAAGDEKEAAWRISPERRKKGGGGDETRRRGRRGRGGAI